MFLTADRWVASGGDNKVCSCCETSCGGQMQRRSPRSRFTWHSGMANEHTAHVQETYFWHVLQCHCEKAIAETWDDCVWARLNPCFFTIWLNCFLIGLSFKSDQSVVALKLKCCFVCFCHLALVSSFLSSAVGRDGSSGSHPVGGRRFFLNQFIRHETKLKLVTSS